MHHVKTLAALAALLCSTALSSPAVWAAEDAAQGTEHNILIAYFTWADNTTVADPASVDVDATTSASLLVPGNAAKLAAWIQEEVGGTLYSIKVTEPYSSDYNVCLDRAADERDHGIRPEIEPGPENFNSFDVVFLGYPNWWYSLPMAVESFVAAHDFSGKTVIPFCTHGTGGLARSLIDLEALLPEDCTLLKPIGIYRPEVDASRPQLMEWLHGLEY